MKTIITKVENNRVAKFIELNDDQDADAELARLIEQYPNAFVYQGSYVPTLWVDAGKVSIVEITPTAEEIKANALAKMNVLENEQKMTRGEREAWIVLLVATAQGQGVTEPQLYAANKFYKKIKDLDAEMAALRKLI